MNGRRPETTLDTAQVDGVTVVVATRDRCARLRRCLADLTALPDRPRVIVVDNGSTDNTASMVRLRFPSVELVRLDRNHGAPARNLGVRRARTPYVAFCDDDSGWEPGALLTACQHLRRHPRLALVAARVLVGPGRRIDALSEHMATAPLGQEPDLPGPSVLGFLACAAVIRRDAFLATGGFDPVVFFMGEEQRVAYDLARRGLGLSYCDDVVALHRPEGDRADRAMLAARNRALTSWMRRPLAVAVRHSVGVAARAVTRPEARRATLDMIGRLPAALARRIRPDPTVERLLRTLERSDARSARPRLAARGIMEPSDG
jgi:GT2 family glycosyltransferase